MSSVVAPEAPHYVPAPLTEAKLEYAVFPVIDLAAGNSPEARASLAQQVRDAMRNDGFFYVINHGYGSAQIARMFDIADIPFASVDEDEKVRYAAKIKETGSLQGYKLREYWHIDGGVRDQVETYSINRDVTKRQHPEVLRPFLPEIERFARYNYENVLHPILRLLAVGMELPEDTFVNMHGYSKVGETHVRFLKYYPRSEEDETKTKNVWFKRHTDIGTVTINWSQPVAALQILAKDDTWKWVKHIENALIINAGDALEFLSGGFYRATIHRVVQPPPDQRNYTRLGVIYFCLPDDDITLEPVIHCPVLERIGISKRLDGVKPPTMEEWRRGKTAAYGQAELKPNNEEGVEKEIIYGSSGEALQLERMDPMNLYIDHNLKA